MKKVLNWLQDFFAAIGQAILDDRNQGVPWNSNFHGE